MQRRERQEEVDTQEGRLVHREHRCALGSGAQVWEHRCVLGSGAQVWEQRCVRVYPTAVASWMTCQARPIPLCALKSLPPALFHRQEGNVSWRVYWSYVNQLGLLSSLGVTVLLFGGQAVSVASDWWLALWSRAGDQADLRYGGYEADV